MTMHALLRLEISEGDDSNGISEIISVGVERHWPRTRITSVVLNEANVFLSSRKHTMHNNW